jgi:hypothetical protein
MEKSADAALTQTKRSGSSSDGADAPLTPEQNVPVSPRDDSDAADKKIRIARAIFTTQRSVGKDAIFSGVPPYPEPCPGEPREARAPPRPTGVAASAVAPQPARPFDR